MKFEEYEIPETVIAEHKLMVKKELLFKELLSSEQYDTAYQFFKKMDRISMEYYMEIIHDQCNAGLLMFNVLIEESNFILTRCGLATISENDKELSKLNNGFFNYSKDLAFLVVTSSVINRSGGTLEIKTKSHLRTDDELTQKSKDNILSPVLLADIQRIKLDRRATETATNYLKREYPKACNWWQRAVNNNFILEDLFSSIGGYNMNDVYLQYGSIIETLAEHISIDVKSINEVYQTIKEISSGEIPIYRGDIGIWVIICSFEGLL